MSSKKRKADETGYCKPPKSKQFKKGQSGNPKGRPKGTANLALDLEQAFQAFQKTVVINEKGRQKTVTKLEAAFMQLANKSASGDLGALKLLIAWAAFITREARAVPQKDDDYREIKIQTNLFMTTEQIRAHAKERGLELPKEFEERDGTGE